MATINEVLKGLEILSKYCDPDKHSCISAEHDEICAGPDLLNGPKIPKADKAKLKALGWFIGEYDCWQKFV